MSKVKNEQILRRWFKHFGFDWKEQHVRAALWICAVVFVGLGLLSSVKLFQQPEAAADHSSSENRASATTQNIHLLAPSGNREEGASGHYEPFDLIHSEEVQLEQAIERILRQIDGVGHVQVKVMLNESQHIQFAWQTSEEQMKTDETDAQGGKRFVEQGNTSRQPALLQSTGTGQEPLIERHTRGEILSVLVVAEGSDDARVKQQLYEAVETLLQIPPHRIYVAEGRSTAR